VSRRIWYEGQNWERDEALERIGQDVAAFVAQELSAYETDASPWRVLVEDIALAEPALGRDVNASMLCVFELSDEWLTMTPFHHCRHHLDTIFAAVKAKPWCVRARVERPDERRCRYTARLFVEVGGLAPKDIERVGPFIRSQASDVRTKLERGVAGLLEVVSPDVPPEVPRRLAEAMRAIDRIEASKVARLRPRP
jgi:hypothetical protein